MATSVALHTQIYLGHIRLTALADEVTFGPITREMVRCTTFADGGYECYTPGLRSGEATFAGFQDFAVDGLDDEISIGQVGGQYACTVVPNPTGTVTYGDPAWISRGLVSTISPMGGAVGEAAKFNIAHTFDTAFPRAVVGFPLTTTSAAGGSGTAIAYAGASATQTLYASLHVMAYTGFTSILFNIQSDDAAGFASSTTRLSFTSVTGTGSEWKTAVGSAGWATETHHRVSFAPVGSGSVTFMVAFAIL